MKPDPSDGGKGIYLVTRKGIDLAPVLTEMVLWAASHEDTGNQDLVRQTRADKEKFLAGVRQRWAAGSQTAPQCAGAPASTAFPRFRSAPPLHPPRPHHPPIQ